MARSFWQDRRGAIAILAAVTMAVVVVMIAAALEYGVLLNKKTALQALSDTAALAGASEKTDSPDQREQRALAFLQAGANERGLKNVRGEATADGDALTVKASIDHAMIFSFLSADPTIGTTSVARAGQFPGRALDIVMCIDATTSMADTINAVRANATSFPDEMANEIKARDLGEYEVTRTRVIYFRDIVFWQDTFASTGTVWAESPFYVFPTDTASFQTYVNDHTQGGPYNTDFPESGLECLHKAMRAEWMKPGDMTPATAAKPAVKVTDVTPLIVLWTDAEAKPLNDPPSRTSPQDPAGMPSSAAAFLSNWNDPAVIDQTNKTFILFGPCTSSTWSVALTMDGGGCGGTLVDGNATMVSSIVDGLARRMSKLPTRLAR